MGDRAVLSDISVLVNRENVKRECQSDPALRAIETRLRLEGKLDGEQTVDVESKLADEINKASRALGFPLEREEDDRPDESSAQDSYDTRDSGDDRYMSKYFGTSRDEPSRSADYSRGYSSADLIPQTREQERRDHIHNIVGDWNNEEIFDKERKEDYKLEMIAEIDDLRQVLTHTQADLSRIPLVDPSTEYETVEQVLKILRHKNDMERGCTMAEELILLVTYAAEEAFDGEHEYFGYKPNIGGYSNHVSAKFRRMRSDTSQMMNSTLQALQIPPVLKMLFELVPGAIMYSHTHSKQKTANHTDRMNNNTRNMRKHT